MQSTLRLSPSPACAGRTAGMSHAAFLEHVARRLEGVEAGRDAAVDRDLQEDLLDLLLGEAVVQRTVDVQLELGRAVERGQHGEVQHRARLLRQAGTRPDIAPAVFRGDVLERHHEVVGARHGVVDIVGAEHGFAHLHALVVELLVARVGLGFRCFGLGHWLPPVNETGELYQTAMRSACRAVGAEPRPLARARWQRSAMVMLSSWAIMSSRSFSHIGHTTSWASGEPMVGSVGSVSASSLRTTRTTSPSVMLFW